MDLGTMGYMFMIQNVSSMRSIEILIYCYKEDNTAHK